MYDILWDKELTLCVEQLDVVIWVLWPKFSIGKSKTFMI